MSSWIFDWVCLEKYLRMASFPTRRFSRMQISNRARRALGRKHINLQSNKNRSEIRAQMHPLLLSLCCGNSGCIPTLLWLGKTFTTHWLQRARALFAHIMFWINLNNNRTSVNFLLRTGNSSISTLNRMWVCIAFSDIHRVVDDTKGGLGALENRQKQI